MLLSRLGFVTSNLCKIKQPTRLLLQKGFKNNKKPEMDEILNDKPYSYSKSKAAQWKAEYNRNTPTERVWYTPLVSVGSVLIFLIYFCILREESDIDEIIYRPLPETLKGIDKVYPHIDFYQKPEYVRFHEENKRRKAANND